ncbi:hypothetical protein PILCRDRAFT_258860 [Piloderma croceum F 1598]|uniref:Uncharacterized protein n=1 Tax=Piloderma croceum (strain F 1598) TaxID=765440 RepID=A0A0C3BMM4_PILCF|nr:hypothetical protein PILCRDRAFT_258860 [Piloderma croceum F 1598]
MKGLSVLRRRLKPPEVTTPRKSPSRRSATASAVTLSLNALKESVDAFPPLKSAVGGVLHILELSRKVKTNKEECQKLSSRVQEMLDQIAVAVPDVTCLSPELHARIDKFTRILAEIEETLAEFNAQLDDELKLFMVKYILCVIRL